ncbi:MAG: AAC(3) family N-acetyltransferase [Desulfobacteraceae bacterium]|nr:AAC(3) family N-acetyltransferase [Desulfobacteraceae bacterium]
MTTPDRYKDAPKVTQTEVAEGLKETGLKPGDVVLVHSAMRTLGHVDGGAETVVAALLEMLGERGTLVVPTFTFFHEAEDDPIIDPANDPSEMGIITETVRRRPNALRSTAYRHSFAAIGRRAQVITEVDPGLSVFDLRSSFGVMLALNTQVLLLGMTYRTSTSHHFAEWVCDVPYRHTIDLQVKVRRKDGSIMGQAMTDYQPFTYTGSRRPDFNLLGRMLEQQGLVGMAAIGNAAVRRFGMRDLVDLAVAADDPHVFRTPEGQTDYFTPLDFGNIVFSPEMLDGCGRPSKYQWCVMDEKKLLMPA